MAEDGAGYDDASDDEEQAAGEERMPSSQRQFDISPDDLIVWALLLIPSVQM